MRKRTAEAGTQQTTAEEQRRRKEEQDKAEKERLRQEEAEEARRRKEAEEAAEARKPRTLQQRLRMRIEAARLDGPASTEAADGPAPFQPPFLIPHPSHYSSSDLDAVHLTALYSVHLGGGFLSSLQHRERTNAAFDFLKPQHPLYSYYVGTRQAVERVLRGQTSPLLDDYTRLLARPSLLLARLMAAARLRRQKQAEDEARQLEAQEDTEVMAAIDWQSFVVVETVDFTADEEPYPAAAQTDHRRDGCHGGRARHRGGEGQGGEGQAGGGEEGAREARAGSHADRGGERARARVVVGGRCGDGDRRRAVGGSCQRPAISGERGGRLFLVALSRQQARHRASCAATPSRQRTWRSICASSCWTPSGSSTEADADRQTARDQPRSRQEHQ